MSSQVEIANRALSRLGARRIISFGDDTEEARAITAAYEPMVEEVLRDHPWNSASTRVKLAELSSAPAFGYLHQYQLPTDCLRVLEVGHPSNTEFSSPWPWVVEGRVLLTDEEAPLPIRYIRRETDPNNWDPLLRSAVAARLAAELAEELTQSNTKKRDQWAMYQEILMRARRADGQEQSDMEVEEDPWILARQEGVET